MDFVGFWSFSFFETGINEPLYIIFVICILTWILKGYKDLYDKMQKVPFLSIGERKIVLDREMQPIFLFTGSKGVIKIKWPEIQKIEMKQTKFIIYYEKNGKIKSQKVDLQWVENKEDLLKALKMKCRQEDIAWNELQE